MICPGSGALLHVAVVPCEGKETGTQALLGTLLSRLRPGHCLLALLLPARADRVFEKRVPVVLIFENVMESQVARRGYSNLNDHASEWMSQALYEQMPTALAIRAVKNKRRTILPLDWMQKSPPGQTSSSHT